MANETTRRRQVQVKRREARASATAGQVLDFTQGIFGDDIHAKRVQSVADATTGLMHAASLGITAMGCGLAAVIGIDPDHAAKQIDRMLGNSGLDLADKRFEALPSTLPRRDAPADPAA